MVQDKISMGNSTSNSKLSGPDLAGEKPILQHSEQRAPSPTDERQRSTEAIFAPSLCDRLERELYLIEGEIRLIDEARRRELEGDPGDDLGGPGPEFTSPRRRAQFVRRRMEIADMLRRHDCSTELRIIGIERTQSVQFFNLNGQGSGNWRDNGLHLIAGKKLVLRVFFTGHVDRELTTLDQVNGKLVYRQQLWGGGIARELDPFNGPVPSKPIQEINRGVVDHSLNFVIPEEECRGRLSFTVTVFGGDTPESSRSSESVNFVVQFVSVPVIPVRGVLIRYTGLGEPDRRGRRFPVDIEPPTEEDLVETLEWSRRAFPVPGFEIKSVNEFEFSENLLHTACGRGCGPGWGKLLTDIKQSFSQDEAIVVGLLPLGVPTGDIGGCGGGSAAVTFAGLGATMGMELGHALGRDHTPRCDPNGDRADPRYGDRLRDSIGEFGLDTTSMAIYKPEQTVDVMSVCPRYSNWISPYTYERIGQEVRRRYGARRPIADDPSMGDSLIQF